MLPWKELQVDVVIESTGRFTKADLAKAHIKQSARKVIISHRGSNLKSVVLGVNENILDGRKKLFLMQVVQQTMQHQ